MSQSVRPHTSTVAEPAALLVSPFQRLNGLLADVSAGKPVINLSVGEPKHPFPAFVPAAHAAAIAGFANYPAMKGTDAFRQAVATWADRRYGLGGVLDPASMVLPLNGSREGLFFAVLHARMTSGKARPTVLLPNPFYQAYAAGAVAAGCEPVLIAGDAENGFAIDPDALPVDALHRAVALFWASPANPQGNVTSLAAWTRLIELAREHDFVLLADECYSEIYRETPVPGVLEAALGLKSGFGKVVSFNSLSKRSNLPGLRCGFAMGDPDFLASWLAFRNMAAPQIPTPSQAVAVAALGDEAHVEENRRLYNAKYDAAAPILAPLFGNDVVPEGGFFLWLDVRRFGDDVALARRAWSEAGLRLIPGSYLAGTDSTGHNAGAGYLRVAVVDSLEATTEAMHRLVALLSS